MKFKVGDKVLLRSHPERPPGIITYAPHETDGGWEYYSVRWNEDESTVYGYISRQLIFLEAPDTIFKELINR